MAQTKWEEILKNRSQLSRKQRTLCNYVADHPQDAAILTAHNLALQAGVGEATVFRFLKEHDYETYSDFRTEVHKYAVECSQSSYWQMKASMQEINRPNDALCQHIMSSVELLQACMTPTFSQQIREAVDLMLSAPSVGVLGLRTSKVIALYFYALSLPFMSTLRQLSYDEHFVFEQIKNMPAGSVLLIISGWPHTKTTIHAAEFGRRTGHRVILLTNSQNCPIASWADITLLVPEEQRQYTIVPYIAVVESIAQEIGLRHAHSSIQKLEEMDLILAEEGITDWVARSSDS